MLKIRADRCQGCGLCIEVCPRQLLALNTAEINQRGHTPVMLQNPASCMQCLLCAIICPDCAIRLEGGESYAEV